MENKKEKNPLIETDTQCDKLIDLSSEVDKTLSGSTSYDDKIGYLKMVQESLESALEDNKKMQEAFENGMYLTRMKAQRKKVSKRLSFDLYVSLVSLAASVSFIESIFNDKVAANDISLFYDGAFVSGLLCAFFGIIAFARASQKKALNRGIPEYAERTKEKTAEENTEEVKEENTLQLTK